MHVHAGLGKDRLQPGRSDDRFAALVHSCVGHRGRTVPRCLLVKSRHDSGPRGHDARPGHVGKYIGHGFVVNAPLTGEWSAS